MPKRKQSPKQSGSAAAVEPQPLPPSSALEPLRPAALERFIEAVRRAVNAALDLADAAADAVTKSLRKT